MSPADDTTAPLHALRRGDAEALDRLMPAVYEELHRIAHRELRRWGGDGTLQTTGLIHEAYLKLVDQSRAAVDDRAHFLALAATAMRHIVIDYVRGQRAQKRGGPWQRVPLDSAVLAPDEEPADVVELHEALQRLERFDQQLGRVVECRFFAGMTVEETAIALQVAPRTIDRAWQRAKAWLFREMHEA